MGGSGSWRSRASTGSWCCPASARSRRAGSWDRAEDRLPLAGGERRRAAGAASGGGPVVLAQVRVGAAGFPTAFLPAAPRAAPAARAPALVRVPAEGHLCSDLRPAPLPARTGRVMARWTGRNRMRRIRNQRSGGQTAVPSPFDQLFRGLTISLRVARGGRRGAGRFRCDRTSFRCLSPGGRVHASGSFRSRSSEDRRRTRPGADTCIRPCSACTTPRVRPR